MPTITNYNRSTPDVTSLVKDGAAAIRTLGSSIDTTTKALNPSTTLGDIEYRSSTANTNTRLGIGSTGNVLTVAGGVPTWAPPAGGGKVLQVVQDTLVSNFTSTSSSYVDVGLTVSITPTSATSQIMVFVSMPNPNSTAGTSATNNYALFNLLRGATQLCTTVIGTFQYPSANNPTFYSPVSMSYLDAPATTSATTYKVQGKVGAGSSVNISNDSAAISSIVVMEIGA